MSDINHLSANDYVSVFKVSKQLNLSVATVRRRCISGDFPAVKIGRNWVVERSVLDTYRVRAATNPALAFADHLNLDVAISRLEERDLLKDMWTPDVLNYRDELADKTRLKDISSAKLNNAADFDPPVIVKVPKTPLFSRSATDLSLPDRIAYQAVVQEIAEHTEPLLGPNIYAARVADPQHGVNKWLQWKNDARNQIDPTNGWVITTDITGFFDFIDHGQLIFMLREVGVPESLTNSLAIMLRTWSRSRKRGLPQGPNASRILANFYLHQIDAQITDDNDVSYFRYMDDIRIVSTSRAETIKALGHLNDLCYKLGLPLSSSKTASMSGAEAIIDLAEDDILGQLSYEIYINDGLDAELSRKLLELFQDAISEDAKINKRRANFTLYRLLRAGNDQALEHVLENLQKLGPLELLLPRYVGHWVHKKEVTASIAAYLCNPERNNSEYIASWLLALLTNDSAVLNEDILNYVRNITKDKNSTKYLRVIAMNVLARSGKAVDITILEEVIINEYDPMTVRGAIVALYRAKKLSKQIRERVGRRVHFAHTLKYLEGRNGLPSLVPGADQSAESQ